MKIRMLWLVSISAIFVGCSGDNPTRSNAFVLDDFESAEFSLELPVERTRWTQASSPESPFLSEDNRGQLSWYNPFDRRLSRNIWPRLESRRDRDRTTRTLVYELASRSGQLEHWNGTILALDGQRDISSYSSLAVWAHGHMGVMNLDIGAICEDVLNNDQLDSEDDPFPGRITGDGILTPDEDLGLDGRTDMEELDYYLEIAGVDPSQLSDSEKRTEFQQVYNDRNVNDPDGDNWYYDADRDPNDYSRINGTQGNINDPDASNRPDTEDINNDGVLNTRNDYYQFAIDLAADPHVPRTEHNGWRLFRLPLFDLTPRVGDPDSTRVEHVRLLISSQSEESVRIEIAKIDIVGNVWSANEIIRFDGESPVSPYSSIKVRVVGTDNDLGYSPPPDLDVEQGDQEHSLALVVDELEPGHEASVTRSLDAPTDFTEFHKLRMYVHGDTENTSYVVGDSSDLELFVRFGFDNANYYEFISDILPSWDGGRPGYKGNEVDMDLLEIERQNFRLQAGLLDSRGRRLTTVDTLVAEPALRDFRPAIYRVQGNPSMRQVEQLTIGIRNRGNGIYSLNTLADELRLESD